MPAPTETRVTQRAGGCGGQHRCVASIHAIRPFSPRGQPRRLLQVFQVVLHLGKVKVGSRRAPEYVKYVVACRLEMGRRVVGGGNEQLKNEDTNVIEGKRGMRGRKGAIEGVERGGVERDRGREGREEGRREG